MIWHSWVSREIKKKTIDTRQNWTHSHTMSFFKFAAHDATISSIIDAYLSIGYKAVATKLAESGIHVKPSTMQKYMQTLSELGVTYLSMSDLIAREATLASIIDADSGIHVKRKTMENYMKSVSVIISIYLSIYIFIYSSIYRFIYRYIYLFINLSIHRFIYFIDVHIYIYIYIY